MPEVTEKDVMKYIAKLADWSIQDDYDESGDYDEEFFEELRDQAMEKIREIRNS